MKKLLLVVSFLALLAPVVSLASGVQSKNDENFFLPAGQTYQGNLYAVGAVANISGNVSGDVIVAGGTVNVTGSVEKDVLVAGGTVNIGGNISEDVRVVGGNITISGNIGGELVIFGGQIMVLPNVSIGKRVKIFGGNVNFDGVTKEDFEFFGGSLMISGKVLKNLNVSADSISLVGNAFVGGNFDYKSKDKADISPSVKIVGKTNFQKSGEQVASQEQAKKFMFGFLTAWWSVKTLMVIIFSLAMFWFWKESLSLGERGIVNFWKNLLWGFLFLVAVPIGSILIAFTVIGALVSITAMIFYILMIIVASSFTSIILAQLFSKYALKKESTKWYWVALSAIILSLVGLIPFIGWIISLAFFLASLGIISGGIYKKVFGKA